MHVASVKHQTCIGLTSKLIQISSLATHTRIHNRYLRAHTHLSGHDFLTDVWPTYKAQDHQQTLTEASAQSLQNHKNRVHGGLIQCHEYREHGAWHPRRSGGSSHPLQPLKGPLARVGVHDAVLGRAAHCEGRAENAQAEAYRHGKLEEQLVPAQRVHEAPQWRGPELRRTHELHVSCGGGLGCPIRDTLARRY